MAITCNCPMTQPGPTLAATCGGGAFMLFMGLLEVFLRSQCDLEDPCGRAQYRRQMDSVYDFIVVGGGSAGSVVAARLSEVPEWRVLLLEAGFDEPTGAQVPSMFLNFIGSSIDWGYHTEPEPMACLGETDRKCYWPRGKVLGGTSVMNGMMYIRGSRRDYDSWAAEGNEGWSYTDVLPYFLKSEDNKQMAITCNCPMTQPGPTLAATCGGGAFMLFMGLLEVFLRSQCDLEDPCGRAQYRRQMDSVYDFIVVGGGSAGSVVAARLSEVPEWRVLLLEAGFDEPTGAQVPSMFLNFIGSSIDWGYHTEPEPMACLGETDRKCYWPRGKVLGGTSVMNGMMYIRGSRRDYDSWAAEGNEGWSYTDVLPYFLKSEDNKQLDSMDQGYHATGGPLTVSQFPYHPPLSYAIVKAGEELGYSSHDLNGEVHTGFSIAQTTNRNGSRLSVARAFLRPSRQRRNLHIMLNATVTKVLINQTTRQAYAVQILNSYGQTETVFANNEIILSAGAVASPQLLQLSGIGDSAVLQRAGVRPIHHLPAVGKNLHNHVAHFLNLYVNDNNTSPLNWATAMEYLLFRDGLMSGTGISEVTGFINTKYSDPSLDDPDIQLFFGGFLADCAKTGMVGERKDNGSRAIQIIPTVIHPKSRGRLEIRSADPHDYPKIYANYLTHPDDVKTLIEGIKFAVKLSETKALRRFGVKLDRTPVPGCEKYKFGCDAYWECAVRMQTAPENHQAGSCKMGPRGDPTAVVDNLLQVQGVDRLRVADASVMPRVVSGNTNAPTVMIGERAADFIRQRWLNDAQRVSDHGGLTNLLQATDSNARATYTRWP